MPFSRFDTWLFDLDGTLVDSTTAVTDCMKQTALDMGGEVTDVIELEASYGQGLTHTLKPWLPEDVDMDAAIQQYMKNFPHFVQNNIQLFDGVEELLDQLKSKGVPMGVVTGNKMSEAQGLFEKLKIGHYFEELMCADSIPFQKPHPEPVRECLKRMGRNLEGAVFIGDSEHDIRSGNLAGVQTIAVLGGSSPEDRLRAAEPHFVVANISEVLEKIG